MHYHAIDRFKALKRKRIKDIQSSLDMFDNDAHPDMLARELLLTTMMCDKRDMLLNADLGLSASKSKIRRVFDFCEKIRNYVAHPAASFSHDADEAERIALANHELIDQHAWTWPCTIDVAEELGLTFSELAKGVRECHELIAAIDQAQSVAA